MARGLSHALELMSQGALRKSSVLLAGAGPTVASLFGQPPGRAEPYTRLRRGGDGATPLNRTALGDRRGLAVRVRAACSLAWGRSEYGGETHEFSTGRITNEALRPALPATLRARDRPARVVVRPAARVAEEDRA